MRVACVLCLVVAIAGGICNPKARRDTMESTFETETGNCFAENQLRTALSDLASGDPSRVERARSELLNKSKGSTACRGEVVRALMKAMDKSDIDVNRDASVFYLWSYGAEILGELEAVEALDLLISHLNFHHHVFGGPSLSLHPAKLGVITMGPIAIPKLSEALKNNSDPKIRYAAIYCIANIGGKSAVTALREALGSESDACAKRLIRVSLDSFDGNGIIKNRAVWFGRFNCSQ